MAGYAKIADLMTKHGERVDRGYEDRFGRWAQDSDRGRGLGHQVWQGRYTIEIDKFAANSPKASLI